MDVKEIFKQNEFFLRPTGFWPSDNERNPTLCRIKAYLAMSYVIVGTVFALCLQLSLTSDPMSFAQSSVTFAGWLLMMLKCTMFYMKRDIVLSLMVQIENGKMTDYWLQSQNVAIKILTIFYGLLVVMYSMAPLLVPGKTLPFEGKYPPIVYEEPWYELLYVIEILCGLSGLFSLMSCDTLLILFICQLCNNLYDTSALMEQYGQRKCTLTDVIKKHIETLNYGKNFCNTVSVLFFGQNCICSGVLCVAFFVSLATTNTIVLLKMIGVLLSMMSVLFINCYGGEKIFSAGWKLRLTIEEYSWRSDDVEANKDICFVIQRAQTPLQISVGSFGVMNLKFFSDSIYTAISYAMVLQTVTKHSKLFIVSSSLVDNGIVPQRYNFLSDVYYGDRDPDYADQLNENSKYVVGHMANEGLVSNTGENNGRDVARIHASSTMQNEGNNEKNVLPEFVKFTVMILGRIICRIILLFKLIFLLSGNMVVKSDRMRSVAPLRSTFGEREFSNDDLQLVRLVMAVVILCLVVPFVQSCSNIF